MTSRELESKVNELRSLEQMGKELQQEIETLKDEIKEEMKRQGTEKINTELFSVSWKQFVTSRFDTKAFQQANDELYRKYCKQVATKRFVVA